MHVFESKNKRQKSKNVENRGFESKIFVIFWLIFREFEVAGARWGLIFAGSEDRIEKFFDTGENEAGQKSQLSKNSIFHDNFLKSKIDVKHRGARPGTLLGSGKGRWGGGQQQQQQQQHHTCKIRKCKKFL